MKPAVLIIILLLNCSAHALYRDPGLDVQIQASSHILDATVESFTGEGFIRIKVNSVLKGVEPPTTLERHYGCRDRRMSRMTNLGKRYIFVVDNAGKGVSTWMEVRSENGVDECYLSELSEEAGVRVTKEKWVTVEALKQRIEAKLQNK